jgi:hypothetical protein
MLGAIASLLAGLFVLWLGVEVLMDRYAPLVEYGNHTTGYGWGILAQAGMRVAIAAGLFWAFARLGGSKPVHLSRLAGRGS